ncbi:TonB-dependent receptor [Pseudomonas sp. A-1]|uniref:TonB-dependent receptor plug domain-containing protein n=1 Tax=Pseudomonas sp. A-1 TaxID=1821274 RepID=UPI0010A64AC5|nr:TonB-dependent receptor [Pseudomonas sp. A-1]THG84474.1 TonB-dependent receptor [Pseudomonas sp. A-1]
METPYVSAPLRTTLALSLGLLAGAAAAEDLFVGAADLPEVLTATRLQQSPAEVPGSVTVLDRELIRASGARELPELLRLVPGMLVVPDGNLTTVNYHGSNAAQARRLQVLVDGRSVYHSGLARVDWSDIPVAIEDIERIEVFRGPNTVSYGANALMAVVSIFTRAPRDTHGTRLKITRGERGIADWYASQGNGWDGGNLRLSLSGWHDEGFDHERDGSPARDDRRLNRLNLRVQQDLDPRQSLDWQLALKEGTNQAPNSYESVFPIAAQPGEADEAADVRARDYAASLRWNLDLNADHRLQVQSSLQHWERLREWRACEAQVGFSPQLHQLWASSPAYVKALFRNLARNDFTPPPGTPEQTTLASQFIGQVASTFDPATGNVAHSCGLINEDTRENRFDLELQDTLSLSDSLRLVSGLSYRHDSADGETYLGGRRSKDIARGFGQFEWQLDRHWLLQGGALYEHDSSAGDSLSPRLALNYLITPAHSLRAVYSEAVRSPDMFENYADWHYRVRDLRPAALGMGEALYFASARGTGELGQEHMRSRELGYHGHFADLGLNLDVKLFHDEIGGLISETLTLERFEPSNDHRLRLRGIESELDWRLGLRDRLRLSQAYIELEASHRHDERLTPRHSGSAGWLHDWGRGWSSSVFYYGADLLNEYRFERLDLRLAKRLQLGSSQLELAGVVQQRLDDEPLGWSDNMYDERRVLWLSAGFEL